MKTTGWFVVFAIAGFILAFQFLPGFRPWLKRAIPKSAPLVESLESKNEMGVAAVSNSRILREPVVLTALEYRKEGMPAVSKSWGLAEMEAFGSALEKMRARKGGSLPSSRSDFGVGVFRRIMELTDRRGNGSIEDQIQLFNQFERVFEIYRDQSDKGRHYDQEMAVLWPIYAEFSVDLHRQVESAGDRLVRQITRWNVEEGKFQIESSNQTRALLYRNLGTAVKASADRNFFRPEARGIMLPRLVEAFANANQRAKRELKRPLERIIEAETSFESRDYYVQMLKMTAD